MTQGQSNTWVKKWRNGQLADNTLVRTTALAVPFVLTMILAGIMVAIDSPAGRYEPQVKRATDLVRFVVKDGLSSVLGHEPITRYYLIKSNGKTTGCAALVIREQKDKYGNVIFSHKSAHYYPDTQHMRLASGFTEEHLAYSTMLIQRQKGNTPPTEESYLYKQGGMILTDSRGQQFKRRIDPYGYTNLIPLEWVDLFTALAIEQDSTVPWEFKILTTASASIPLFVDVTGTATPSDTSASSLWPRQPLNIATVKWGNPEDGNDGNWHQVIAYDQQYQIVQQHDIGDKIDELTNQVSRQELLDTWSDTIVQQLDALLNIDKDAQAEVL